MCFPRILIAYQLSGRLEEKVEVMNFFAQEALLLGRIPFAVPVHQGSINGSLLICFQVDGAQVMCKR